MVELDGRLGHEDERFRDMRRDNASTVDGRSTLRYGWVDTTVSPCAATTEVAGVLHRKSWTGRPIRCGPSCTLPPAP